MWNKIFVSYKFGDSNVQKIANSSWLYTTVRDYVDLLENNLLDDHIYKWEGNDEDLSHLTDDVIKEKLKTRMRDSSITIVLVSPKMKEDKDETLQRIPREISYSLKETTFEGRTNKTNGMLAVVLPDFNGSYDYAVTKHCATCNLIIRKTNTYFEILWRNMFNKKESNSYLTTCCQNHAHHWDSHSYIYPIKWLDFISDPNSYIAHASALRESSHEYDIMKSY